MMLPGSGKIHAYLWDILQTLGSGKAIIVVIETALRLPALRNLPLFFHLCVGIAMMSSLPVFRSALLFSLVAGLFYSPAGTWGQDLELPKPSKFAIPPLQLELGPPAAKPMGKKVEVKLKPAQGTVAELKAGGEVTLSITINVPPGSHAYSMTTPKGGKTRVEISKIAGLKPVGEEYKAEREPETKFSPEFDGFVEEYAEPITWTRQYRLLAGVTPEDVVLAGKVHTQICDDRSCLPVTEAFHAALASNKPANALVQKDRPQLSGNKAGPAELTATLAPKNAKPGEKVTLTIQMAMDEGWHTYSITQKKAIGAKPTKIQIEKLENLKPLGEDFTPSEPFEKTKVDVGISIVEHELHHGTISWTRQYEVLPPAEKAGFGLQGNLDYQTCTTTTCFPNEFAFNLHSKNAGVTIKEVVKPKSSREARLERLLGTSPPSNGQNATASATKPEKTSTDDATNKGLLWFIVAAVAAGFGALLTPCVYPMVPITISFFLKQSEKQHHRPLTLALVYCGGIMATFTGLGLLISALFQATDLNRLANNVWLNLMLTGVIAFFGISMLGVFEIRVPSWVLTWSAGKEQKGGIIGTLFMALTFTLVSFTCTFAFAGGLLVMASKGEVFWPIVGMLAFSGAFASPFFLLALFPKMLAKLPKSGGWMNIIKTSMGFLEIGAALKFLSVADAIHFGQPTFLTYNVVMGTWFALAVLAGLYPLGLFRMPHDTPGKFTLGRLAFAAPFLALGGMLGSALFTSYQPSGWVWENVAAFAPPRFEGNTNEENSQEETLAEIGPYLVHDNLKYSLDFFQALDYARKTNRPLFVDFTGQNCINCRRMELTVLPQPKNRERLEKFVRVQLFMDQIPLIEDPQEREALLSLNRRLQQAFEDVTLPGYVVLNPHDLAENGKLNRLSDFFGMEEKTGQFTDFLDKGFQKFQEEAGGNAVQTARGGKAANAASNPMTAQR